MTGVKKVDFIYEGKAKKIYSTTDNKALLIEFKDDLTAFNALKKGSFENKGQTNLAISELIFNELEKKGIKTHRIKKISDTELLVKKVTIVPLEVIVRNKAAGSICKRLGIESGVEFKKPVFEVFYKKDELGDPLLTREHIEALELCEPDLLEKIKVTAFEINQVLKSIFNQVGIDLIDFKIEFGLSEEQELLLADEISPDSCRLWDLKTKEILDKDRFRKDLGSVKESYLEILTRLKGVLS